MSECKHNVYRSVDTPKMGGTVTTKVCTACSVELVSSFVAGPRLPPAIETAIGHALDRIERLEKALSKVESKHMCSLVDCVFCDVVRAAKAKEKPNA